MARTMAETIMVGDHRRRRVIDMCRTHDHRGRPADHGCRMHDDVGGLRINDRRMNCYPCGLIDYGSGVINDRCRLERFGDDSTCDDTRQHLARGGPFTVTGVGLLRACDEHAANCKGGYDFFHTIAFLLLLAFCANIHIDDEVPFLFERLWATLKHKRL
jgi:hypothetical protein